MCAVCFLFFWLLLFIVIFRGVPLWLAYKGSQKKALAVLGGSDSYIETHPDVLAVFEASLLVLSRECGNEPRCPLKGNHMVV